ncbi:MAG: NAD-dependent epimerase/dehydratase family protein [SAR202 cluster bacterium]|nr:NAD-dependent epimerase/dehydratase family protein [SAR202 cluster bacterium]|tara:strand:- start:20006 stop:21019 length:1014 start_codon:yes stop_codon:yes gene_type:complete
MRTVVVTGAAGLFGSHFSRHLLSEGYRVIGIDDLSGGYSDYLPQAPPEQFEFWPINISDRWASKALNNIFHFNDVAACFHFAAYAAEGLSPYIRHFNYTNNVLGSVNIINQCIEHDTKMIFTSSMAVYGNHFPPFNEKMGPAPIDPYGVAKYAIEMDIKIASEQHGLRYTIIRPHNVVGIYQNIWDKYRNVAGIFIRRVLAGEPMLIYGDGEQTRAFSDVKYYMKPFETLIDRCNGYTFNLGADKAYTINELADTVQRVAWKNGFEAEKKHVEGRHEAKHAHCDHTLAKDPRNLGFHDGTNLEELIDEMFKWAMKQPEREQKRMDYEIEKGIYDYWK